MPDSPNLGPNPERGTVAVGLSRAEIRQAQPTDDAELLIQAKKRFRSAADHESPVRARMLDDQRFRASHQWPDQVRAEREMDGRPCLTINRLPVFIRQVTNQQRQSKPAITINPVDSGSDPKTAEVLQGIIRHIEVSSEADIAYDTACDHQVTMGRGYFRVVTEWNEINPWDLDVKIKRVRNPFTVYMDPSCVEADYHDARYAFVIEDLPKDEFTARYGEDQARSAELFASVGDRSPEWMPEGKVRIAEYYYVDVIEEHVSLLSDGTELPTVALKQEAMQAYLEESGLTVVRSRKRFERRVKWAKITGSTVLEKGEWPGRWIPIIPVLGDEIDVNGEVDYRGMVRDAKDPQRMYNYWISAETETIALAPRSPFIAAEGQLEGYETQWKQANRRNFPFLNYKPIDVNGQALPPPTRNSIEPPIAAIVAATKQSDNDLKSVTGIFDASLGERGPQEAARAILARQKQSDIANVQWVDNLARAMRALGRVLLDLIPKVYDTPRVMRIMGLDDKPQMVMVHADNDEAAQTMRQHEQSLASGITGIYDLAVGRYDVTVTVGPSYQSRRQEAVEAMTAFMQAYPPAAPAIGDVLAENMDWPGAGVIAKRLRKMVPPQLMDEEGDQEQQMVKMQGQLQQASQMLDLMTQQLNQLKEERMAKTVEMQSREKIEAMRMHTQIVIAQITATKDATLQTDAQRHEMLLASLEGEQETTSAERDFQQQAALKLHEAATKGHLGVQQAVMKGAEHGAQHAHERIVAEHEAQQAALDHQRTMEQSTTEHSQTMEQLQAQAQLDSQQAEADRAHEAGLTGAKMAHETQASSADRQHEASLTRQNQAFQAKQGTEERRHQLAVEKAKPRPTPTTGGRKKS